MISICSETCKGGSLWISDPTGDLVMPGVGRGRDLPLTPDGVFFNARTPHFTYAFEGLRMVAVAFHIRSFDKMKSSDVSLLRSLNFNPVLSNPSAVAS